MQTIRQWLNTWLEISKIPKAKWPSVVKVLQAEFKELKDLTCPLNSLPLERISQIRVRIYEIRQSLKRPRRKAKPGINRLKNGRRVWVDRKTEPDGEDQEDDDDDVDED